jgi:AraC family transcriptional regulator, regulatory protein of adaptative response / methylated-DNA-[protein]-cysteine methyltransferase
MVAFFPDNVQMTRLIFDGGNMTINYTIVPSDLGRMLIAGTSRGVCSVLFGNSTAQLAGELQRRFGSDELHRDDARMGRWARVVAKYLSGESARVRVPLDMRGTAFQRRVWRALRKIRSGQTASYREVARAIGRPRATRAVAQACAANPVAVIVPCHRVIRNDGGLGGFRWGLARKRQLLRRESR